MKRSIMCLGLLFFLTSCGGINVSIDQKFEFTLPANAPVEQATDLLTLTIDAKGEIEKQGFSIEDINGLSIKKVTLKVLTPASADLSFMNSLTFSVSGPGVSPVPIATQTVFPVGQSSVDFTITKVDLKPYLPKGALTITAKGSGTPPTQTMNLQATAVLDVQVSFGSAVSHIFK